MIAFLSYLTQILMAVMMATFMAILVPRAAVCADRIQEVLDTDVVGRARRRPGHARCRCAARSSCATSASTTRAPRRRCSATSRSRSRAGHDDGDHRQHRVGQDDAARTSCPACSTSPPAQVLVDGVDVRELDPTAAAQPHRPRAPEAVPVLRHGGQQPALRQARRHRRRAVGGADDRPGRRLRGGHARRADGADRSRAARTCPAASASGWPSPGRSCASRRSTCSTTRSRRSTWPPTPACAPRWCRTPPSRRSSSSPSGCRRSPRPTRSSCSRTASTSASAPTTSCSPRCPTYAEIVDSQFTAEDAA